MHDRTAMLADFIARRLLNTRPPQRADVYPIVASARPIFLLIAQFRPSPRAESQALGCIGFPQNRPPAEITDVMITAAKAGMEGSHWWDGRRKVGAKPAPCFGVQVLAWRPRNLAHVERRCGHGYDSKKPAASVRSP